MTHAETYLLTIPDKGALTSRLIAFPFHLYRRTPLWGHAKGVKVIK
jgi:hypothetical protein